MTKARSNATAPAAKGEIVAGTGSELSGILSVGANGTVLTANSATATGLAWAAPASSTATLTQIASGTLSGTSLTISGLSSYDQLYLIIYGVTWSGGSDYDRIRLNNTQNNYASSAWGTWGRSTFSGTVPYGAVNVSYNSIAPNGIVGGVVPGGSFGDSTHYSLSLTNCKNAGRTSFICNQTALDSSGSFYWVGGQQGVWDTANTINSIRYETNSGRTFTGGNYVIWGA